MSLVTRYRHRLKRALAPVMTPILGGPLEGQRICLFAGVRFVRGTYSAAEVELFQSLIQSGDVVYDIGAHVGYFSLVAAQLVGPAGRVLAFEPAPLNLAFLNQHKRANGVSNLRVIPSAVGGEEGSLTLEEGRGSGRGRLATGRARGAVVEVKQLDRMLQRGEMPPPNVIKMDVEGAEGAALRGAERLLERYRPTILLSLHGPQATYECRELLTGLGFEMRVAGPALVVATHQRRHGRIPLRSAA